MTHHDPSGTGSPSFSGDSNWYQEKNVYCSQMYQHDFNLKNTPPTVTSQSSPADSGLGSESLNDLGATGPGHDEVFQNPRAHHDEVSSLPKIRNVGPSTSLFCWPIGMRSEAQHLSMVHVGTETTDFLGREKASSSVIMMPSEDPLNPNSPPTCKGLAISSQCPTAPASPWERQCEAAKATSKRSKDPKE